MGETKRRGAKGQRIEQALDEHKPVSTDQVKMELGIPNEADLIGYVVHLPESDEFLSQIEDTSDLIHRTWAKTPELALRYEDFHKAKFEVERYGKGSVVALLFDLDDQMMVGWS